MKILKAFVLSFLLLPITSIAQLTVEDFFKYSQADSLRLSPDGKYLAVRGEATGKKRSLHIRQRNKRD